MAGHRGGSAPGGEEKSETAPRADGGVAALRVCPSCGGPMALTRIGPTKRLADYCRSTTCGRIVPHEAPNKWGEPRTHESGHRGADR
jgi:hypothetical protein